MCPVYMGKTCIKLYKSDGISYIFVNIRILHIYTYTYIIMYSTINGSIYYSIIIELVYDTPGMSQYVTPFPES